MPQQNTQFDFNNNRQPSEIFSHYHQVIIDRGSRYSVSMGRVTSRKDIVQFMNTLKSHKQCQRATHYSYAARISQHGTIYETKRDDGEAGAGQIILRIMQQQSVVNGVVCVTRWFGGTKLMNDRFAHIQTAARYATEQTNYQ